MVRDAHDSGDRPEVEFLRAENKRLRALVHDLRRDLLALRKSTSWRITAPFRGMMRLAGLALHRDLRERRGKRFRRVLDADSFDAWLPLEAAESRRHGEHVRSELAKVAGKRVSLLMLVHADAPEALNASVASLQAQIHRDWQLCIIDMGSLIPTLPGLLATLAKDPRIRVSRLVPNTTASALRAAAALADGDILGLLYPGDVLAQEALGTFVLEFQAQPDLALVFADEDRIDETGKRSDPRFKTGWSPDLILADPDAIGRPWLIRRHLLEEMGGFRDGFDGAEEYDLLVRAAFLLAMARVRHIPRILGHHPHAGGGPRRSDTSCARAALCAAQREDSGARLLSRPVGHWFAWSHRPAGVSVIIPTRDRADLLAGAAQAVLRETGVDLELLIVDNDSREKETAVLLADLRRDARVRVIEQAGPFNWSELNAAAVARSRGEVLVLLNNDIAAVEPGWLAMLVAEAMRPAIGIVGAKLIYPGGTLQHGGLWFGQHGAPHHLLRHAPAEVAGYLGQLVLPRNLLAVTGACLAIRRAVYDEIGGADPGFPIAFNDIDLCLRAERHGYRVLWTPLVQLIHLEGASRGDGCAAASRAEEEEAFARFRRIWAKRPERDPYFNPNLDLGTEGRMMLVHPWRPV
jgi:O-antigen biosynthesis protein